MLLFGTRSADYIRASGHSGCIATEVILQAKQAEYMAAPERFAEMPDFSLAPRAPSIHGTNRGHVGSTDAPFDGRVLEALADAPPLAVPLAHEARLIFTFGDLSDHLGARGCVVTSHAAAAYCGKTP